MAEDNNTSTRLDRIEQKLDKLSDAIISLARAEEKIGTLMSDHEKMHERLNRFSEKLDHIEKKVDDNSYNVNIISKLFWAVLLAAIGAATAEYLNIIQR